MPTRKPSNKRVARKMKKRGATTVSKAASKKTPKSVPNKAKRTSLIKSSLANSKNNKARTKKGYGSTE